MGEDEKVGVAGIISKIFDKISEKAGEQIIVYGVIGMVCWVMYSMIVQNNKDNQRNFDELKVDMKECQKELIESHKHNQELTDRLLFNQKDNTND